MNNKDWTGNTKAIYSTLAASNHSDTERAAGDYYATEPKATRLLLENEKFNKYVWEPAAGGGHMVDVLKEYKYIVRASDIVDRGCTGVGIIDFLKVTPKDVENLPRCDIITNPPYKYAREFVEKALELSQDGDKIAMFLKLQFLEGQARRELFKQHPPKTVYVSSGRLKCAPNGDFDKVQSSAVAYAWFVWEKGYTGRPKIKWIN